MCRILHKTRTAAVAARVRSPYITILRRGIQKRNKSVALTCPFCRHRAGTHCSCSSYLLLCKSWASAGPSDTILQKRYVEFIFAGIRARCRSDSCSSTASSCLAPGCARRWPLKAIAARVPSLLCLSWHYHVSKEAMQLRAW